MLRTLFDFVSGGLAVRARGAKSDRLTPAVHPTRRWLDCTELEDRTLLSATPLAAEALVNTTTTGTQQTLPESPQAVASDANGNFVVVWTSAAQDGSGLGIYAQRYNALGVKQGSEFLVNTTTANDQTEPAVAMNASGNFIITWSSAGQDGSGAGIYAQRYDASGNAQGGEFQVNTTTALDQTQPAVGIDSAGDFVISWTSDGQDGDGLGVYAQRFDPSGNAVGGEFQVNTTTAGDQDESDVAMNASGAFVISFTTDSGGNAGVRAQIYDSSGVAQGSQIQVNTTTTGNQQYSSIAIDASGNFIVTWTSGAQDGDGNGIYAQQFNSTGSYVGTQEFLVNTTTAGDQQYSRVASDSSGNFVIAWESYNQDAANTWGIYAQQYDSTGAAIGGETLINSTTAGDQRYASVTMVGANQYDVVWSGNGTGDADGVFLRQYVAGANQAPVNTVPGAQSVSDNATLVFSSGNGNQISVADSDSNGNPEQVTVSVSGGTLTLSGTSGLTFAAGANGSASMTVQGTLADINAALNGLTYTPPNNLTNNSSDTLTLVANDLGFTGTGGPQSANSTVAIAINHVDLAPSLTVPGTQSVNDDTALTFSSAGGNAITLADADANAGAERLTLSVGNGTLALGSTTGLTFTSGSNGSASMIVQGTLTNLNNALNGLTYTPPNNLTSNSTDTLSLAINDLGSTGSGGPLTASNTVDITLNHVDRAPVVTAPGTQTVSENTNLVLSSGNGNQISVSDVDANGQSENVSLVVTHGTLSLSQITGLSFTTGTGTGDTSMQFTGTLANINAALNGLTYTPTSNFNGASSIGITVSDLGNTGSGGPLSASQSVGVTVAQTDQPPANTVPAAQSVNDNATLVFSSGNGNLISVADSDSNGNPEQVTLSVGSGTLALSGTTGLTFTAGSNGSASMTVRGTLTNLNNALNGLTYTPPNNLTNNSSDTLTLVTNDLGNSGSGGPLTASSTVDITLNHVDRAPAVTAPGPQTVNENTNLVFSSGNGNQISISDVDANGQPENVSLVVTHGTLSLSQITGLSFTTGTGAGDSSMQFTGTLANINAALNGLTYTPASNFSGASSIGITTSDLGNTGSGGPLSASQSVGITVTQTDQPPVNTVPAAQSVNDNATLVFSSGNGNQISVADSDSNGNPEQVTLSVGGGTLALGSTTGLTFTAGSNGSASMTVRGTLTNLNNALNGLIYTPPANLTNNSSDTLHIATNDLGNTGSGGPLTANSTVAITINHVDAAPVNTAPGAQTITDTSTLTFSVAGGNQITLADPDANGSVEQATLSVGSGTLALSGTTGLTFTAGSNGSASMTVRGTLANLNNALNGLTYTPPNNLTSNGSDTLSLVTNDLGNSGSGGPLTASSTIDITLNHVNRAPVVTLPGSQTVNENSTLVFSSGNGNTISVNDVDAGSNPVQVTLTASNGTLTLNGTTGLIFTNGSGAGDATMTFIGTIADINTALNGMAYHPTSFYNGPAAINITANDQGNTGLGGPQITAGTVNIAVNFVNFGPSLSTPGPQTSDTYGLVFSTAKGNPIMISDASVGSLPVQVTLTATNGTFNLPSAAGLTINSGGNQDSASIVFTGTVAQVNSALNGLVFYGTSSGSGLQINVSDLGNAGGPALSASAIVSVDQKPVFPAPSTTTGQSDQATTVQRLAVPSAPILAVQTITPKVSPLSDAIGPRHAPHAVSFGQPTTTPFGLVTTRNETTDFMQMAMRTEFVPLRQSNIATRAASLNMADLWTQIDTLADQFSGDGRLGTFTFAMTGLTAAFSAGYVLWCMHGSSLLASVLSALPAWKSFDPLPVLEFWDKDAKEPDEDEEDEPQRKSDDAEELLDLESLPLQV